MHTLVIANDKRTADSIARYYSTREMPFKALYNAGAQVTHASRYGSTPATQAYPILLKDRPARIIIGGDYLRWYFGPEPGRLTNLWRVICAARARGTQVVFN